jgi:hypothetical protein
MGPPRIVLSGQSFERNDQIAEGYLPPASSAGIEAGIQAGMERSWQRRLRIAGWAQRPTGPPV